MLLAWVQKHWPLILAFSGGLKITGQNEIGQNLRAINCTLSLCGESNPNPILVIVLCLEFFRNLNARQSLHASTLPMGKAAKRRTEGREWGRGGEQIQRGMLQSCPQPHKKHCQLLSYAWCLGEAESSEQSVWDRKDTDFICQLLPISCLSLVQLHPVGCELSYIFWFINSCWGSQSLHRSNKVRSLF